MSNLNGLKGLVSYSDDEDDEPIHAPLPLPDVSGSPNRISSVEQPIKHNDESSPIMRPHPNISNARYSPALNPRHDERHVAENTKEHDEEAVTTSNFGSIVGSSSQRSPRSPNSPISQTQNDSAPPSARAPKADPIYEPPNCCLFNLFPKTELPSLSEALHDGSSCQELSEKIKKWTDMKDTQGIRFNDAVLNSKEFHNPSIHYKMMDFLEIKEFGSNYSNHVFDLYDLPPDGIASTLSKRQDEMLLNLQKKQASTQDRSHIKFIPSSVPSPSPEIYRKARNR